MATQKHIDTDTLDSWWYQQDFNTIEKITGFKKTDFPLENGSDDFVEACENFSEKLSYEDKLSHYNEFN